MLFWLWQRQGCAIFFFLQLTYPWREKKHLLWCAFAENICTNLFCFFIEPYKNMRPRANHFPSQQLQFLLPSVTWADLSGNTIGHLWKVCWLSLWLWLMAVKNSVRHADWQITYRVTTGPQSTIRKKMGRSTYLSLKFTVFVWESDGK